MPRTRLDPTPHPLARLIWGTLKATGKTPEDVARPGLCGGTIRRRLANPESFTVGELVTLSRALHIPIDDIRACIRV